MTERRYDGLESEFGGLNYDAITTDITAPLISGSAATFTPSISTSVTIGAPVISGSAGLNLLNTMEGFWDASTYSGSGDLLNKGTAGASGDMVLGASSAAPTFSGGKFHFDGSNDYMANAGNVTAFDMSARGAGNSTSIGIVVANPSAANASNTYISKSATWTDVSNPGYMIIDRNDGQNGISAYLTAVSPYSSAATGLTYLLSNTDIHLWVVASHGATDEVWISRNVNTSPYDSSGVGSDGRTSGASCATTTPLVIGKSYTNAHYQTFDLYGAFVYQGALTAQNRADIYSYFTGTAVSIGSATKYTPTASSTSSTTAPLISGTGTTYTPTIASSTSITAPLVSGSAALFTPVFGNTQDVTLPVIDGSAALFTPDISTSALQIFAPLISGSAATFNLTITTSADVASPLVSGSAALFTPAISYSTGVTAPLISGSAALFTPTVSSQLAIAAPLISGTLAMFIATLTGVANISAPLISGIATLFLVSVLGGDVPPAPYMPGPDPGTVQQSVDTLGCGRYEVYFKTRGGDLFVCRALNITSLSYGRVLNGVSEASIEFSMTGQQGNCCECVALINPWQHEMSIYRDGEEVWCGPVTGGEINDGNGTGTFQARDLSAWFSKRWVEVRDTDIDFSETDIIDVFNWLIGHAYYKDPWNMEWLFTTDRLGIPIDRTYISFDSANERWGGNYPMVEAELNSLTESGVDYTIIRRVMLAGDLQSSLTATARFSDAHWVSPPSIIITGSGMATQVAVAGGGGGSEGWYDDQIWIERPNDSYRQQFGLLQHFESEGKLDEESTESLPNAITQRAYGLREIKKKPFEYINGGSLSRHAPVTMDQLIPGRYFRVDLNQTCRNIQGNYMLTRVSVSYSDEEENIQIDLTPPGAEEVRG